jgi:hypothetical protein
VFKTNGTGTCGNWYDTDRLPRLIVGYRKDARSIGKGVFSTVQLEAGTVLCMYFGVYKYKSILDAHDSRHYENGNSNYYGVTVYNSTTDPIIIDGRDRGNIARFINHSHEPNCVLHNWVWKGRRAIAVMADTTIYSYSEITVKYENETTEFICKCSKCNKEAEPKTPPPPIKLRVGDACIPAVFWNYENKLSAFISVLTTFSLHTVYDRLLLVSKDDKSKLDPSPVFYELRKQHNASASADNRESFKNAIRESILFLLHFLWQNQTGYVHHKRSVHLRYHLMVLTHTAIKKFFGENDLSTPSNIVTAFVHILDSSSQIRMRQFKNSYPTTSAIIDKCSSWMDGSNECAPPNVLIIECPTIHGVFEIPEELNFDIIRNVTEHQYILVAISSRTPGNMFNTFLAGPRNDKCPDYNRNWYKLSHDNPDINVVQHAILKNTYSIMPDSIIKSTFKAEVCSSFVGTRNQTESPHLLYYVKKKS